MNGPDLDRLRFLLTGLREPAPAASAERRALSALRRIWPTKAGVAGKSRGIGRASSWSRGPVQGGAATLPK